MVQPVFYIFDWFFFSTFLKKLACSKYPSSVFLLLPLLLLLAGYDFYSYSESKVGISQCVGCGNQNSATFVVLESRSGGLYARLSPFNLHNIRVVEQVSQLGIHNTSAPTIEQTMLFEVEILLLFGFFQKSRAVID